MFRHKSDDVSSSDWRTAIETAERERAATREKFIAAQTAPHYDARFRIRLWEQLHAMHLPNDANHRLVRVIAAQTALTLNDIKLEQERRATESQPLAAVAPEAVS